MSESVREAFWAYERALAANDGDGLAQWFVADEDAIRTDSVHLLAGHTEISHFQRHRVHASPRRVERLYLRHPVEDVTIAVAETRDDRGNESTQLQVWCRGRGGWRIHVAQVAPRAPRPATTVDAEDASVWRAETVPALFAQSTGGLSGIRLAVKDMYRIAGQRVGAGNPTWLADAPVESRTAQAVSALVSAGATIQGLVRTDELAFGLSGMNRHYGTPPNPRAVGRIPGGSSSGCAAAVAGGCAEIGLGTDTAGSIRVPASYCGLYGLRLTHGVCTGGLVHLAPSFDAVGVLTQDLAVMTSAYDALSPRPPVAAGQLDRPITRLVFLEQLLQGLPSPVRASFHAALEALTGRMPGRVLVSESLSPDRMEAWLKAFRTVQAVEAWGLYGEWIQQNDGALAAETLTRFEAGRAVSVEALQEAQELCADARSQIRSLVPPGSALLLPSTTGAAPVRDTPAEDMDRIRAGILRLTFLASVAGLPALSAPVLFERELPVGLSLVGGPHSERALLRLAGS